MTAIAYKAGVLAGDTMTIYEGGVKLYHPKVFKHKGWIYGASGDCPEASDLQYWLFKGLKSPRDQPPFKRAPFPNRDFNILAVSPNGEICVIRHHGDLEVVPGDFYAVGAGKEFCMGAMAYGASAADAVALSIKHCEAVGGDVTTVRLRGK
jgi:hypothetical protein